MGDAAYAPSLLTGQDSSLVLVGVYLLAESLAAKRDHAVGFAIHERDTRAFVTLNQQGKATLFPTTARALEQRNTCCALLAPCSR